MVAIDGVFTTFLRSHERRLQYFDLIAIKMEPSLGIEPNRAIKLFRRSNFGSNRPRNDGDKGN